MEVERDLAGISLPFAAGVAAVIFSGGILLVRPGLTSISAYAIVLVAVCLLLHPVHHRFKPAHIRVMTGLCLMACGVLCGISSEMISFGKLPGGAFIQSLESSGAAMGKAIDAVNFRSPVTNAIIKALIIGDRTDIPPKITEAFRESGASHILALSGLHLGIIYGIIVKLSSFIGNSPSARLFRSVMTISACGIYTLAVGAGPSIVRAFLFILLGETALITGRFRSACSILMASLLIHLVIAPDSLSEISFQLSYAAMTGIAFIFPSLRSLWPKTPGNQAEGPRPHPIRWIWETAALSISCQITTGPLAYMYFGTFPTHFLLTNLIALPLTGLIIPLALASACLSSLGICPDMVSRATEMLVTTLSEALEIISEM